MLDNSISQNISHGLKDPHLGPLYSLCNYYRAQSIGNNNYCRQVGHSIDSMRVEYHAMRHMKSSLSPPVASNVRGVINWAINYRITLQM